VIENAAPLPPKVPLAGINLTLQVKGESKMDSMDDKLDLLDLMVTDLTLLVEDKCGEPPVILQ
jgi:hypothetical protein